jgi:hypothetical protein
MYASALSTLPPPDKRTRAVALRALHLLLISAVLGSFALSIAEICYEPDRFQWDLKVYYTAPILYMQGADPYAVGAFAFPPMFLPVFKLFSNLFTYGQFHFVFLFAKILSFVLLLTMWKNFFLKDTILSLFLLVVWLAFYSTIFIDFKAGNISVFETTLLFLGFLCFLKSQLAPFVLIILLASSAKLTPIVFVILLLLSSYEHKVRYFVIGCAGFVTLALINLAIFPEYTKQFIFEALERTKESEVFNPSSLMLITYLITKIMGHFGLGLGSLVAKVLYVVFATSILWASWNTFCTFKTLKEKDDFTRFFLILFSILVYTLTMPRMKDYAYMLAIPSILFAVERFEMRIPRWLLFVPFILISPYTYPYAQPPLFRTVGYVFWHWYPLLIAFICWYVYSREVGRRAVRLRSLPVTPIHSSITDSNSVSCQH